MNPLSQDIVPSLSTKEQISHETKDKIKQFEAALGDGLLTTPNVALIAAQPGELASLKGQDAACRMSLDPVMGTSRFYLEALQVVEQQV